jgi:hypothetical protein
VAEQCPRDRVVSARQGRPVRQLITYTMEQGVGVGSRARRSPVIAMPMRWKEAVGSIWVWGGNDHNARAGGREHVR